MKSIAWIIGIIVIVIAGIGLFVLLNSGDLIKTGIEKYGSAALGAEVSVEAVNLDLAGGSAQILGLTVGNPAGLDGADALNVGEVKVLLDPGQISESLIVIKQVLIDGADVALIAKGKRSNFQQLMENVERSVGSPDGATESSEAAGAQPRFIVDRLDFTNAAASVNSDLLGDLALDIPDVHLTDIGRKSNGVTAAELAQQFLKPISDAATRAAVEEGLDLEGVKARAKQRVQEQIRDKISSGLRGLTDRLKEKKTEE